MIRNYCTLFSKKYLSRGLALYASLKEHSPGFHLYVFCFDDETYGFFCRYTLESLTPVPLSEFEDTELLRVKPTRTLGEYCWTCTSSVILYSIEKFSLPECTYLDADLFFFGSPEEIHSEMPGGKSVLITEHRYSPEYDISVMYGKYCVQFLTVKNNHEGLKVLQWWRSRCIEWCYARVEDGKFGDQKYLDDWVIRFPGVVHELKHLGGGVAPWNVQQYEFERKNDGRIIGYVRATSEPFLLVFYHFHYLKITPAGDCFNPAPFYKISNRVYEIIYKSYLISLKRIQWEYDLESSLSEFPDIPSDISEDEMENEVLSSFVYDSPNYRSLLALYEKTNHEYTKRETSKCGVELYEVFLNSNYHLTRAYDRGGTANVTRSQLEIMTDRWYWRKVESLLYFKNLDGTVDWSKGIPSSLHAIGTTASEFEIAFQFSRYLSTPVTHVFWTPFVQVYGACRLKNIEFYNSPDVQEEKNSPEKASWIYDVKSGMVTKMYETRPDKHEKLGRITHNGLEIGDSWVEFVRLNPFYTIPLPPGTVRVCFKGLWKRWEPWEMGSRVEQLIGSTMWLKKLINGLRYRLWRTLLRPLLRMASTRS